MSTAIARDILPEIFRNAIIIAASVVTPIVLLAKYIDKQQRPAINDRQTEK